MTYSRCGWSGPFRLLAVLLAVALMGALALPARAEADPTAAAGIVSVALAGVMLIAYLVITSFGGPSPAVDDQRVPWLTCAEGCPASAPATRAPEEVAPNPPAKVVDSP